MDLSNFKINKPVKKIHNQNQAVGNSAAEYLDDMGNVGFYCMMVGIKGIARVEFAVAGVKEAVADGKCYDKKRLFMYLLKDKKHEEDQEKGI